MAPAAAAGVSAMAELVELGSSVAEALAPILDDLAEGGITRLDRDSPSDRNAAVAQTLQLSRKRLTAAEQVLYEELAVLPEDEQIPRCRWPRSFGGWAAATAAAWRSSWPGPTDWSAKRPKA
jgi:hypothetical protein